MSGASLIGASINLVFGILVASVLARYKFPGKRLFDSPFCVPDDGSGHRPHDTHTEADQAVKELPGGLLWSDSAVPVELASLMKAVTCHALGKEKNDDRQDHYKQELSNSEPRRLPFCRGWRIRIVCHLIYLSAKSRGDRGTPVAVSESFWSQTSLLVSLVNLVLFDLVVKKPPVDTWVGGRRHSRYPSASGQPHADENMVFTSFRYNLP